MNNRKEDMEIASHYRHLLRELNEQRQHGVLCDVCVVVEGKVFKAHKNVLLGSSRYFKTLYCQVQKTSEQATVTHLDIVTAQGFKGAGGTGCWEVKPEGQLGGLASPA